MATKQYTAPQQTPAEQLSGERYNQFLESLINFRDNSDYPYNKRIFVTLCQPVTASAFGVYSGEDAVFDPPGYSGSAFITPIRTSLTENYNPDGPYKTNNLAELSTFEVIGKAEVAPLNQSNAGSSGRNALIVSDKFKLNQQYINKSISNLGTHIPKFDFYVSGSYLISQCTDDNPSLLLELNKAQQLPGGIGDKEFIIIPEDLHPFIKDNLLYFLTQAGVNVGGDTSALVKINSTNKTLF
tara:strand:- start:970 stop:1692 length:723 start_codon:yes stop_codon:yes gene_type:complete